MKKTVLSKKLTEIEAIKKDKSLVKVNEDAGFGPNFIYRLWGRDNIELATVNRIANALSCSACDLLEEIDDRSVQADSYKPIEPKSIRAASPAARSSVAAARQKQRDALVPIGAQVLPADAELTPAETERRAALLRQAASRRDE